MTAQLDNTRIGRDVQRLVEEVISHLLSVDRAQVEQEEVVRTVSENCLTLQVRSFGFDE